MDYLHRYSRPLFLKASNAICFLAFTTLAPVPVQAQQEGELILDEVIVTARKREESLQETPISMTVFDADTLREAGISNIKDFNGKVPGLNMENGNGNNGDANIFIRGIGQRETKSTIDSGVAIYVDGVYLGRAGGGVMDTNDIENIQVLRGPQGTLFGKNVTGGAMVLSTRKPQAENEGFVSTRLGNYNRREFQSAVNIPVTDKLYTRLTLSRVQRDGYMENQVDGEEWSDENRKYAQWQWRLLASDSLIVDWLYNFAQTDQRPRAMQCRYVGDPANPKQLEALAGLATGLSAQEACLQNSEENLGTDKFYSNITDARYKVTNKSSALTVNWELGETGALSALDMKSITAWRQQERRADEDLDAMALPILEQIQATTPRTTQLSEELQFIGSALDDRLNFTTGFYLFHEKTDDDAQYAVTGPFEVIPGSLLNPQIPGNLPAILNTTALREINVDNEAYAWFTQTDFDITPQIEVTLGIRWTTEIRRTDLYRRAGDFNSFVVAGPGTSVFGTAGAPLAVVSGSNYSIVTDPSQIDYRYVVSDTSDVFKDSAWTPMASISYQLPEGILDAANLDSAMVFFTYSEGFRSGGLVEAGGVVDTLDKFKSETVRNYEIGIKMDALEKKLRANLAFFYTEYDDMQLTTVVMDTNGRPQSRLDNAGKALISGAEMELTWLFLDSWRTTISTSYTDADMKDFEDEFADAAPGEAIACLSKTVQNPTGVRGPAVNGNCSGGAVPIISRADEAMPRSARKQAFVALEYIWSGEYGTLIPHVDASYRSEIYLHFDRDSWLSDGWVAPSKTFYNARLTWMLPGDNLSLALWGQNLADEDDYITGGLPLAGFTGGGGVVYAEPRMYGLEAYLRF